MKKLPADFDPKPTKYPFPEDTGSHYLVVKKNNGTVLDKNYPYVDESGAGKLKRGLARLALDVFAFLVMRVRLGLRVLGRENIKKNRELLKGGAVSCANHVHLWDYMAIMYAVRPFRTNILAWAKNIRGENGTLIRLVGGVPVPEGDVRASIAMISAVKKLVTGGGWIHVYAEGSMWEYYRPIRPFKSGAAYFAVKCGRPLVPLGFSYRKPGWIRRRIFRQTALFTLNIGEPLVPDETLPENKRIEDLIVRSHDAVCRLAGIDPAENLYPPVYDGSKRVDYYPLGGDPSGK
ncbi:MAG: 1-acyl-sn-glycerol-3-phosphate acyltransferase [Clostridia bacterium]|nr:1-acyl-sn-glycerol-3-phosphate acyltransferase [Clostridia bacterium]